MSARCGFAALIGAPNAGKSTLLNRLAGAKLAIVTPKAQTTRGRVLGIVMRGESQILLLDTPGIFTPRRRLDQVMVEAAWNSAREADTILLLVDSRAADANAEARAAAGEIAARLAEGGAALWLVLNKIDLLAPHRLLALTAALHEAAPFAETLMISATTGDGVATLLDRLAQAMPEGPHLYPEDQLSDLSDRAMAAEIVREQIFLQTHAEVPYGATVVTESFRPLEDGSVRIEATIHVDRPGHKAILIGAKGARIREIGARARAALGRLLERDVHLFLVVKQDPGWHDDPRRLRALGLETPHPGGKP